MPAHANRCAIAAIPGGYPPGPSADGSNSLPANLYAVRESSPNYLLCLAFCAPCALRFTMLGYLFSVSLSAESSVLQGALQCRQAAGRQRIGYRRDAQHMAQIGMRRSGD